MSLTRKLAPILFVFCLYAADPWKSKPFTEWSDKEVNKILTNSPWAREVTLDSGVPAAGLADGADPGAVAANRRDPTAGPGGTVPSGGGLPSVGSRGAPETTGELNRDAHHVVTVRWQSALPLKQALARRKYGAEAGISPVAKKIFDDNSVYLIAVSGLPATNTPPPKSAILAQTSLSSKGKDLRPSDVVLPPPGTAGDTLFVFQKTTPFTPEDKDVEFSTKLGPLDIKCKFRLKDMLYNSDLAL
jgi:hypothetical protein